MLLMVRIKESGLQQNINTSLLLSLNIVHNLGTYKKWRQEGLTKSEVIMAWYLPIKFANKVQKVANI